MAQNKVLFTSSHKNHDIALAYATKMEKKGKCTKTEGYCSTHWEFALSTFFGEHKQCTEHLLRFIEEREYEVGRDDYEWDFIVNGVKIDCKFIGHYDPPGDLVVEQHKLRSDILYVAAELEEINNNDMIFCLRGYSEGLIELFEPSPRLPGKWRCKDLKDWASLLQRLSM
jgi:hypothetical protein